MGYIPHSYISMVTSNLDPENIIFSPNSRVTPWSDGRVYSGNNPPKVSYSKVMS